MSRLTRDGTAQSVSPDQILRHVVVVCCCFSHSAHWLPARKKLLYTVANPARGLLNSTGTGEYYFPCSADHEKDWQPYPVDPYSAICDDHKYTHIYRICVLRKIYGLCFTLGPTACGVFFV